MYDVIVVGAGPSGIMASIAASSRGKKVLLIEKNNQIGKKLKLTGGNRCNLTNLKPNDELIKNLPVNGKYLYSSLNNFNANDIYNFFTNRGLKLKKEDNDRVFPITNSSLSVIEVLQKELMNNNVQILFNTEVKEVKISDKKIVITNNGSYEANNIIIATGGLSYQNTGSTGDGYNFAKQLGHKITELYPAETYLITKSKFDLSGITMEDVEVSINRKTSRDSMLFTHVGLTGPAIQTISEFVYHELKSNKKAIIKIDFTPNTSINELEIDLNSYQSKSEIKTWLRERLPSRLADTILIKNKIDGSIKIASLSTINKQKIINSIKSFEVEIIKTGSIEQAFVTGGGISLDNINTKTMESKLMPGIYFVGEILDFHGQIGGYNLTIAFSTGYTAGLNTK